MVAKPRIGGAVGTGLAGKALRPAEWLLLALVLMLGAACLGLVAAMGRVVEWQGFAPGMLAALAIIALGGYARAAKGAERLAAPAIGVGLFMGFTAFTTLFIYALFPLPRPMIDQGLIELDARLGYDWAGFVAGLAELPGIGTALGWLYMSSLGQIIFVIVFLGVTGRETALHRFLMVGMLTMICAIAIWWLWPSVGPSAWARPEAGAAERIGLIYTPDHGAVLLDLVRNGPAVIRSQEIMGMVAFPSYHIVMALMVAWFTFRTLFFLPFALAGLGMVPATLAHGGHHLADLIAGLLVFLVCVRLAARLVPGKHDFFEEIVPEPSKAPGRSF